MTTIYKLVKDRATGDRYVVGFCGEKILEASGDLAEREIAQALRGDFDTDPLDLEYLIDLWRSNLLVEVQL